MDFFVCFFCLRCMLSFEYTQQFYWQCFSLCCVCVSTHVCMRAYMLMPTCVCVCGCRRACLSTCMCMYSPGFRSPANRWREDGVGRRGDGYRCRGSKPGPGRGVGLEQRGDRSGCYCQHHWAESHRKQSRLFCMCFCVFVRRTVGRLPIFPT